MRAQCSICTELFDNSSEITALPCGHTFHDECVDRWLHQSLTCPQCRVRCQRNKVIKRLYFNEADIAEADDEDPSKLKNELDSAKLAVKQQKKETQAIRKEKLEVQQQMEGLRESFGSMEALYKQERASGQSLQREVAFYKKMVKDAEVAKAEAKALRKKFENLKAVETMIQGCESEVQDMIHHNSDPTQIATWCGVLQKELHTKRQELKTQRESADRLKRELHHTKRLLSERTNELETLREKSKTSLDDLSNAEREIASLRKKITSLERALGSPSDNTAVSFARRLIHESPAPMPSAQKNKRPRLSDASEIDLDITPDLFPSPEPVKPSPSTSQKNQCKEYGTTFIKIKSAASTVTVQAKGNLQDVSNIAGMNLFKKKTGFGLSQETSVIRKGYNGLGGYERFVTKPAGSKGALQPKKAVAKPAFKSSRVLGGKVPPLPRMDNFD